MIYKCPYCDFETDNLMVYLIHVSNHPEWWHDKNSLIWKIDNQHKNKLPEYSISPDKSSKAVF